MEWYEGSTHTELTNRDREHTWTKIDAPVAACKESVRVGLACAAHAGREATGSTHLLFIPKLTSELKFD